MTDPMHNRMIRIKIDASDENITAETIAMIVKQLSTICNSEEEIMNHATSITFDADGYDKIIDLDIMKHI